MPQFDLRTHHYNEKGQVVRETPYRMVCDDKGKRFERPPNSGNWFHEDGTPFKEAQPQPAPTATKKGN